MLAHHPDRTTTALSVALLAIAPAMLHAQSAPVPVSSTGVVVTSMTEQPLNGSVGGVTVDKLGYVYVADFGEKVYKIDPYGELSVFVDDAYGASGNTIDAAGNLLQADFHGHRIRRIARDGTATTLATGLAGPVGMTLDDDGNLVVCNCRDNTLKGVDATTGEVTLLAESELFSCPNGITRGPDGAYYVVNFRGGAMLQVQPTGEVSAFATIPGGGAGHVVYAGGDFYATGFRSNRVYRVTTAGEVNPFAGTGRFVVEDGPAAEAAFTSPNGIAFDPTRDVLYTNDYTIPFTQRGSVAPKSVVRRIAFPGIVKILREALTKDGVDGMTAAFRTHRKRRPNQIIEPHLNGLGYGLLQAGQLDGAVAVFRLNAETHPKSWNAHDSLGEALAAKGEREEAIASYERSVELNPASSSGRSALERLRRGDTD